MILNKRTISGMLPFLLSASVVLAETAYGSKSADVSQVEKERWTLSPAESESLPKNSLTIRSAFR